MGMDRTGTSDRHRSRETVALPSHRGKRRAVGAAHRLSVARSVGALWTMANGVFPVRAMATGRGVGAYLAASSGTRQRHGSHRVERLCGGWDVCPCASTRRGSPASGESARRKRGFAPIPGEAWSGPQKLVQV
jgi:hypothetical protein